MIPHSTHRISKSPIFVNKRAGAIFEREYGADIHVFSLEHISMGFVGCELVGAHHAIGRLGSVPFGAGRWFERIENLQTEAILLALRRQTLRPKMNKTNLRVESREYKTCCSRS